MLERLPYEVLLQVTRHLGLYSKLRLIETCHKLHFALYQAAVLEELTIPAIHIDSFLELFEQKRLDGRIVKKLTVDFQFAHEHHFQDLPRIFPNLTELYTDRCLFSAIRMQPQEINNANGLRHSLKRYDNERSHESILLLLENNVFERLTHLSLRSYALTDNGDKTLDIKKCLINTPKLVSLKLASCVVNIAALEGWHKARPELVALELADSTVDIDDIDEVDDVNDTSESYLFLDTVDSVVPIDTLKSFKLKNSKVYHDSDFLLLDYITKKYTKLESLDIDDLLNLRDSITAPNPYHFENNSFHEYMNKNMLKFLSRLKSVKISPRLFGSDYMDEMDPTSSPLVEAGFYSGGNTYDAFKDKRDLEYIQTLPFLQSLAVEIKNAKCLCHDGINLPNITSLHLYDRVTNNASFFTIDRLMSTYSGLKRLTIDSANTTISISNEYDFTVYRELKALILNVYDIKHCAKPFIEGAFPRLTELSWSTMVKVDVMLLNFQHHTFKSIQVFAYGKHTYLKPDTIRVIRYEVHTSGGGEKVFDYVSRARFERKVVRGLEALPFREDTTVIINCHDIYELREGDVVIFN